MCRMVDVHIWSVLVNADCIQQEGRFPLLSRQWAHAHVLQLGLAATQRGCGQVVYGTFPGSGMLRAGSDWATEAVVLEQAECGSVLRWWTLDAPQPTFWKLACGMRYPPAAAGVCVALLENSSLVIGHPLIFSCRGASWIGKQNCGFLLQCNLWQNLTFHQKFFVRLEKDIVSFY